MKSVIDKVKDIVEICPFTQLHDFAADPALTLTGYHFTDITSDLMAKWVDRLASVKPGSGCALALAGFRGVGKSHFLSVIAAIVSNPELRSKISDPHVAAAVDRLSRRHNPVAVVRRGTGVTLLDELRDALGRVLNVPPGSLSDPVDELMSKVAERAGDMPLVILVDTALERGSRIARNDGALLSEIATLAKDLGIFIGVALDDDISGADGANSSIAAAFSIDYLDQEHLYKIVDTFIFAKQNQKLAVLHDIYEEFRASLPGFRWSEQRFSSLYPLHPATLEIAPIIRLYIPDFALLGFAADAGVRILGRPANSLIGLDEIFDGVEKKLRAAPELSDVFAAFDRLQEEVVARTPVNIRLHAKLILKGFFLLSLDGQGSTAAEIAAAMMISEGPESSNGIRVADLLEQFAAVMPEMVERSKGADAKYRFKLTKEADSAELLSERAKMVPDEFIWACLLKQSGEKFADIGISATGMSTYLDVEWRNAIRRGAIRWQPVDTDGDVENGHDLLDWTIIIDHEGSHPDGSQIPGQVIIWKFADLSPEEKDTIRGHHLLQADAEVRESLGDGLVTAVQGYSIAVEKIWYRVVLRDASLVDREREYSFDESIRSIHSLGQLLTRSLAPVFADRFTSHPEFQELLDARRGSDVINNFFTGSSADSSEVQKLAEGVAAPLGLAVLDGERYVPTSDAALLDLEHVRAAIATNDAEARIPIERISSFLMSSPFGLTREARQLVLASLVAQKQFEFVTSSSDRISHRSLDLQIIWDDIVGLAKPLNEVYPAERLLSWAKLITGNTEIRSLDNADDRERVIASLNDWLASWRDTSIIDKFEALEDEDLNAGIWKTAFTLRKTYGAIAEMIAAVRDGNISVEKFLQSAADVFSDSEAEFARKADDLRSLNSFMEGVAVRREVTRYLSVCEITADTEIENARRVLVDRLQTSNLSEMLSPEFHAQWKTFKGLYVNHYAERHDAVMKVDTPGKHFGEVTTSGEWPAFEHFSSNPLFDGRSTAKVKALMREIRQMYCTADVRAVLEASPHCICTFELGDHERLSRSVEEIRTTIRTGLNLFSATVAEAKNSLLQAIDAMPDKERSSEGAGSVYKKIEAHDSLKDLMDWSSQESRLLGMIARNALTTGSERTGSTMGRSSMSGDHVVAMDHFDEGLEPAGVMIEL